MMVQKHLHELLQEDQEPFLLQNYIADRRSRLNIAKNSIVGQPSSSVKRTSVGLKSLCLFSFYDSPDPRTSPLLSGFLSPAGSTNRSDGILHVPARTYALLLEAAMKIHKQSVSIKPKPKSEKKVTLGLIDLVLKRLGSRKADSRRRFSTETSSSGGNCHLNLDRRSVSMSNEQKSRNHIPVPETGLETSFTSIFREELFSFGPQSPSRSPKFSSPVASPASRRTKEIKQENKIKEDKRIEIDEVGEEDEQFSPVSVLEPQFEEDDDDETREEETCDPECSLAIVQRAKQQLLEKLKRFERLARLDPLELDKTLFDDDEEDLDDDYSEEEHNDYFLNQVMADAGILRSKEEIGRLVSDLIMEEEKVGECETEIVMKRVCMRLDAWKESKHESIDMMVELDFKREFDLEKEVKEAAMEIQIEILVDLVEEVLEELIISC